MALLASKRVRKNITAQIFGGGSPTYGSPTIIAFMKAGIPMPGEVDTRFGGSTVFTMFDYCNETLNWSSQDGAGGTNRSNYLGFAVVPANSSNGMFYSDENGIYFNGQLDITVVSEGTIGSVMVYHGGASTGSASVAASSASIPTTAQSIANNYIAIGEVTSNATYFTTLSTGSAFNGTSYVNGISSNNASVYAYQNVLFITDSVGTGSDKVVNVSSMTVSTSTTSTLDGITLKISEAF